MVATASFGAVEARMETLANKVYTLRGGTGLTSCCHHTLDEMITLTKKCIAYSVEYVVFTTMHKLFNTVRSTLSCHCCLSTVQGMVVTTRFREHCAVVSTPGYSGVF